ncbi:sugar kinase [Alkalicoccus luteus]|uniref:Sugar kinase n=1 Tax=Alkalicoccus luteus TaxID=1237094 RepID=A0A969PMK6_9BACI|nr:sugar kinase [Alkalicoccus luteus]NJP36073.1 sugar kinase [Alkalicoccus luteus]
MTSPEVITMGETMVIMNPQQDLPLEYVDTFRKQIGGAESNVAVGVARLGHTSGWISRVGDDPFGTYIEKTLRGEGIDLSHVARDTQAPTGFFFKERRRADSVNVYYYRAGSAASRLQPGDVDPDYVAGAKLVHVSGILPALSIDCRHAADQLLETAKNAAVPVVFDPNVRMKLWNSREEAAEILNRYALASDYVLIGQSEGELLADEREPEAIASFYQRQNPELTVVVKLGEDGAFVSAPDEQFHAAGYPVQTVTDPIGAGDAFAAAFMSGLLHGETLPRSVQLGNAAGACTVQAAGDIEGFPSRQELEALLQAEGKRPAEDVNR